MGVEEVKRFIIALYKVCRACSGMSSDFQVHELEFPMPRNTPLWNAMDKEEWVAACLPDVHEYSLDDMLEHEWISGSGALLEELDVS